MSNNMLQSESYWLSVEGRTEKLYFAWLAQQINEVDHRKKNLKLNIKVEKSPKAFAKKLSIQSAAHYVHVCDVEIDQAQFKSAAKELSDIGKAKSMRYQLAYCNCSISTKPSGRTIKVLEPLSLNRSLLQFSLRYL